VEWLYRNELRLGVQQFADFRDCFFRVGARFWCRRRRWRIGRRWWWRGRGRLVA
jgi:hypothetical protein